MRAITIVCLILIAANAACAGVMVSIPMDQQIDIGLGDAIMDFTDFYSDPDGGLARRNLTMDYGGGGWYFGPTVDFTKAGYGPSLDLSQPGVEIQFEARYFQGDGNTNPYADCGIWAMLFDANGRTHGIGGEYGPDHPDPPYPAWQVCSDDMTLEGWPDDPDFDLTQVTGIQFFGTDWSGVGNDFVDIRKLLITDPAIHDPVPIAQAKNAADDQSIEIAGVVSASLPRLGLFYVEDRQRVCGIQVRSDTMPSAGSGIYVQGTAHTDPDTGEMYIACDKWRASPPGSVAPLLMTSRSLGGGEFGRQCGVDGGVGLNNVGLLVRTTGEVTNAASDNSWALVNGGGGPDDVFVDLRGLPFSERPTISVGQMAAVTGISTIYADYDSTKRPAVLVRCASDCTDVLSPGNEPKMLRAAVVNFDPFCPGYGGVRTPCCHAGSTIRMRSSRAIRRICSTAATGGAGIR